MSRPTITEALLLGLLLVHLALILITQRFVFSFVERACLTSFLSFVLVGFRPLSPPIITPLLTIYYIALILPLHRHALRKQHDQANLHRNALSRLNHTASQAHSQQITEYRDALFEMHRRNQDLNRRIEAQMVGWDIPEVDEEMFIALTSSLP